MSSLSKFRTSGNIAFISYDTLTHESNSKSVCGPYRPNLAGKRAFSFSVKVAISRTRTKIEMLLRTINRKRRIVHRTVQFSIKKTVCLLQTLSDTIYRTVCAALDEILPDRESRCPSAAAASLHAVWPVQ